MEETQSFELTENEVLFVRMCIANTVNRTSQRTMADGMESHDTAVALATLRGVMEKLVWAKEAKPSGEVT